MKIDNKLIPSLTLLLAVLILSGTALYSLNQYKKITAYKTSHKKRYDFIPLTNFEKAGAAFVWKFDTYTGAVNICGFDTEQKKMFCRLDTEVQGNIDASDTLFKTDEEKLKFLQSIGEKNQKFESVE